MVQTVFDVSPETEQRLRMTLEEFLAWDYEGRAEWVDGEVTVFVSNDEWHQDRFGFVYMLLRAYAKLLGLGKVLSAPYQTQLARSVREPDVMFISTAHLHQMAGGKRIVGPPDLAIEFVSEDSPTRDRRDKRREYAEAGVPEYWIFEGRHGRQGAEFLQLDPDGTYRAVPLDAKGRYYSRVLPGFWMRPAWLWRDPLPDEIAALKLIAPGAVGAAADPSLEDPE